MKTRKDSKGYLLHTGEYQRKDGLYTFIYIDKIGKRRVVYGNTLVVLREKERTIRRDMEDGLDPTKASHMTVNDLVDVYLAQKHNLRESTRTNYYYVNEYFIKNSFGKKLLMNVKYSHVKEFYYSLMSECGLQPATVESVNTILHPAFQMAVRDDILRKNPTDGVMNEIKRSDLWVKKKRHALTIPQQKAFINFIDKNYEFHGWLPIITVLLGTGMRIGECLGIRWQDLDFDNRIIRVDHSLSYRPNREGKSEFHVSTTKTEAGIRIIPMIDDVYDAFLEEYQIQSVLGFNDNEIDGYSGFVFTSGDGNVFVPEAVNNALHRIRDRYNNEELAKAESEQREPLLIPEFSAHHLRHTFCTRLCENETNLKVIQAIMGHSDISTTMDIYAEATAEKKQEVFANLNGKIVLR